MARRKSYLPTRTRKPKAAAVVETQPERPEVVPPIPDDRGLEVAITGDPPAEEPEQQRDEREEENVAKTKKRAAARKTKVAPGAKRKHANGDASKGAELVALMSRKAGATLDELRKHAKWEPHSVRGFISGHVRKKLKLKVERTRNGDGVSVYRIA